MPYKPIQKAIDHVKVMNIWRDEQKKALGDIGGYVRSQAAKYPPPPSGSTYRRTGTLGKSITVGPVKSSGKYLSTTVGIKLHYAKHVEFGTGIFGKNGRPIRPKNAKVLSWKATGAKGKAYSSTVAATGVAMRKGKIVKRSSRNVYAIFAREVKGMKGWHYMERAFTSEKTKAFYRRRAGRLYGDTYKRLRALQGGA